MRHFSILSVSVLALTLAACGDDENSTNTPSSSTSVNAPPTVSAGADQVVQEQVQVQLSGTATDPDGDRLSINWSQQSGPMVEIDDTDSLTLEFRAPNTRDSEIVVMRLSVSDGVNGTVASDVAVTVNDTPRDGESSQGIRDNDRDRKRDRSRNRDGNRIVVGGVEVRTYDGSANNLGNVNWGATFEHLQRLSPVAYSDGISTLAGEDRPSARAISNAVHHQDDGESLVNTFGGSDFVWQWGQFLDHDLDLTDGANESADIPVPEGDAFFDPTGTGAVVIPLNRALFDPDTGATTPREQENEITSWIDGSMVYGSDDERAEALRDPDNRHLLAVSDGNLLPFNTAGLANANIGTDVLFLAGDVRANEQVGLTVMHTLFVREHNRMAQRLMDDNPNADPDDVFETARRLLIGKIQHVTYNEWLPMLIGQGAIPAYSGYDATINPTIYNEFSVAAFRLGHTMLNEDLFRIDNEGNEATGGHLALADGFFAGTRMLTSENDIDPFLRGFATQSHQAVDAKLVMDVRNFLFGPPGSGGLDLASLNIQRGRDHGVGSYNATRLAMGLATHTEFSEISSDPAIVEALEEVYDSVDDIDLWTGGLAEDAVNGSQLGELFQAILVRQFTEIRDGDRFWYETYLPEADRQLVEDSSLARIIRDNTAIGSEIQSNVFRVR